ncbi:DUF333 domain-containing protein [Pantoea sp. KPR_PJ]
MALSAALITAGLQLTACAQQHSQPRPLNMHNPAADWCIQSGGKLSQVQTDKGVIGYCTLPSGERIEEWALYHRDHPEKDLSK